MSPGLRPAYEMVNHEWQPKEVPLLSIGIHSIQRGILHHITFPGHLFLHQDSQIIPHSSSMKPKQSVGCVHSTLSCEHFEGRGPASPHPCVSNVLCTIQGTRQT